MDKELVIFDLDGTLINSLDDLADALNYALSCNYMPLRTGSEVKSFVGNGIRKLIERGVAPQTTDEMKEKVYQDFCSYYQVHCADKTKPYPDVAELIKAIKEKGIKTAVVSNKADTFVQKLCKEYFEGLIDYAVGAQEGIQKKPAPDSIFKAMKILNIPNTESAVYIGDSEVDIATAKNAGVDSIIVTWGFRDRSFLEQCGEIVLADSTDEIKKLLW